MNSNHTRSANIRPVRPSIIIGLGGTGQRIVLEVRKRIIQEYGDLDKIPIIGFLVIDTDSEKPIIPGIDDYTLNKIQLSPSELVHAKVTGTHKLNSELRSYPHLAEWVDKSTLERGDITVGAKGIRAIGRLAYFLNYINIKKAFNGVYSQVTNQPNLRYMAENYGTSVASGVNVFIITSVCGGTGSGMFLDLAFTVKDILAGTEHQRMGYLILPGVFGTDMAKGAGYAAMRELNHYSLDHDFEANWENEPNPRVIQPPPFDFCYIVNNGNSNVNFSQKEHLFEMVAHNIFLEFSHEFGQYKSSLRDNIQAVAIGSDRLGCPLNFISLGLSTISFPREKIINACSHRLAREVVERWLSKKETTGRMNEYIDHFLDYNRLYVDTDASKKNLLKDELIGVGSGKNYYSRIDEDMNSIFHGIRNQRPDRYDVFVDRRAEEIEKRFFEGDEDPERWGEYFRGIHRNKIDKKKQVEELLVETVSKMIQNDREGLDYAKDFLEMLEERFIRYRDYFRGKFDQLSKAEGSFSKGRANEMQKLKGLKKKFVFDKKRVMLDQVDKLTNTRSGKLAIYFKRKIDKKILEMSIVIMGELAEYSKYLLRELDLFKEKLTRIHKSIWDSEKTLVQTSSGQDVYSLILYEPGDVDYYYNTFLRDRDRERERDTISATGQKVLEDMGKICIFDLRKDEFLPNEIRESLVKNSSPSFVEIMDVSVAKKFFEKYPTETEQMMHLKNIFSSSEVFLRFKSIPDFALKANSKVSLIGVYEGRSPSQSEFKHLLPLLERSCTDANQLRGIQPIRRKDEILFTTEEGAFPVRRITEIDDYEAKYDKLSRGSQNPLHLRKYDKDVLVEIIQPAENEQRKAKIGVYMGIALGVIKPDEDDDSFMVYTYRDPNTGFIENKPMGRVNEEEKMIDTLLHRFNRGLREIIFNDIDRRLSNVSKNNIEKRKIWHKIRKYRSDYFSRRDREFVEKKRVPDLFKEIIEEYRLYDQSFIEEVGVE
ncbi:MAG: tubulin-like doman-containing protein [Candidatus Eremiobacteraeota bacterium]|nr:tubulin-like doman-containing protein [Candidatus Eremiobacteraeota bacterium]